jgi:hypothetical protein
MPITVCREREMRRGHMHLKLDLKRIEDLRANRYDYSF